MRLFARLLVFVRIGAPLSCHFGSVRLNADDVILAVLYVLDVLDMFPSAIRAEVYAASRRLFQVVICSVVSRFKGTKRWCLSVSSCRLARPRRTSAVTRIATAVPPQSTDHGYHANYFHLFLPL